MVEADGFGNKPLWLANSPEEVLHLKLEEDDRMMGEEPSVNQEEKKDNMVLTTTTTKQSGHGGWLPSQADCCHWSRDSVL